jgi:hypothetical protein
MDVIVQSQEELMTLAIVVACTHAVCKVGSCSRTEKANKSGLAHALACPEWGHLVQTPAKVLRVCGQCGGDRRPRASQSQGSLRDDSGRA